MKKQWQDFLDENNFWSYGIVPSLVNRLSDAIDSNDDETAQKMLDALATQGVIVDSNDNLCFVLDLCFERLRSGSGEG